jgi:hypothetical protein
VRDALGCVMTARRPCPAAPGPLEDYAARFDDLFHSPAQRRGFREYLAGLLVPRDRNKTLTALAGAEPVQRELSSPGQPDHRTQTAHMQTNCILQCLLHRT